MYKPIVEIDNKAKLTQLDNRAEITVGDDIIYKGELISRNGELVLLKLDNGRYRTFIVNEQKRGGTMPKNNGSNATGKKTTKETKGKHPGGRPTKYKEEYCKTIVDYFDLPATQTVYKKTYHNNGELKGEEPVVIPTPFPTLQGYAHSIGVSVDTMIEWGKVHKEFSEAYTHAKALQEQIWLTNAMCGLYNAQFAQFYGKNCLGYKDKQEVENKVTISKLEDIL